MKTAGIIAEYNPFHNGHRFHIEETRRRTGADYIIIVMSGDFVQRGAPACLDKYTRTQMALHHGADLVLELPVTAALSSAEGFAGGGVSVLESLGVVDFLSFGIENNSIDRAVFQDITKILADEPQEYQNHLALCLKQGLSFPKSREQAVLRCFQARREKTADTSFGEEYPGRFSPDDKYSDTNVISKSTFSSVHRLLSEPNSILALEYAKTLRKTGSSMEICMIPRQGTSYHASELSGKYCSATAIRKLLLEDNASCTLNALQHCTPSDIANTLCSAALKHQCLCENDFSDLLFCALTERKNHLSDFGSLNSDLSIRTAKLLEQFESWVDFSALLKSKNQTYTAISRYLAQILLNITRNDLQLFASFSHAPYTRVLGFKKDAAPLLAAIGRHTEIPVLMQLAKDAPKLGEKRKHLLDLSLQSSEIYKRILFSRSGYRLKSEYRQPLIVI